MSISEEFKSTQSSWKSPKFLLLLFLGISIGGWLLFASVSPSEKVSLESQKKIAVVKKGDIQIVVSADGSISNESDLEVNFLSSGVVEEIFVTEGVSITQGSPIARLN